MLLLALSVSSYFLITLSVPVNALSEPVECVLFVNAGGCAIQGDDPSANLFSSDSFFQGGESIETSESIVEGGDYPSLYSSARYGDFSYRFDGLAPGDYYLDLHFAEIVHTAGPTGIRSFDVLVQQDMASSLTCFSHKFRCMLYLSTSGGSNSLPFSSQILSQVEAS